jgi:uncharacterized membrane protein
LKRLDRSGWLKISGLFVGAIIIVAIFTTLYPRNQEQFMSMAVLGEHAQASNYFPNNSSNITTQTQVQWYLHLYNHMSETKNIIVRVKLQNSTDTPPSDQWKTPSPIAAFMQIPLTLLPNETRLIPFTFRIEEIVPGQGSLRITRINVGYHSYTASVKQQEGTQIRFVFELWSYDSSNNLIFSWKTGNNEPIVWNQMWFKVMG